MVCANPEGQALVILLGTGDMEMRATANARSSRLAAGLLATALALPQAASPASAGSDFNVRVTLQPTARVEVLSSVASFDLTPADASSLRAAIPAALSMRILTTQRAYSVDLAVTDPAVAQVEVLGLGRKVVVGAEGYRDSFSSPGGQTSVTLAYVVTYRQGVKSGQRANPLRATVDLS